MGKIIAIGGGDNGWGNSKYETLRADLEIVNLTKKNPVFLFIGFASLDIDEYYKVIRDIFKPYGCRFLNLDHIVCKKGYASEYIGIADIIYVGGGSTLKLMKYIEEYNLVTPLINAYNRGAVMCGVSAGANCWCSYGNSAGMGNPICVQGIGLIDIIFCPHSKRDPFRHKSMLQMLKEHKGTMGLELDFAALEVIDNQFRIIKLDDRFVAKKEWWINNRIHEEYIKPEVFFSIDELYVIP